MEFDGQIVRQIRFKILYNRQPSSLKRVFETVKFHGLNDFEIPTLIEGDVMYLQMFNANAMW
jgi:hypothetical protein